MYFLSRNRGYLFANTELALVITADHGEWPEEGFRKKNITYDDVRRHHRIPLLMYHPKFDASIQGIQIPTLATDVDTAPTILAILGIEPEVSSFMGENIFAKKEDVIVKYGEEWLSFTSEDTNSESLDGLTWDYDRKLSWARYGSRDLINPKRLSHKAH